MSPTRCGTVLILCVGVIVLMVALSSGFLLAVAPQRGAGHTQAVMHLARMAAFSGRDHAIATLLQDHGTQPFTTLRGAWRQEFKALDGSNAPVSRWETQLGLKTPSADPQVNVSPRHRVLALLLEFGPDAVATYKGRGFHSVLGAEDDGDGIHPTARWHELDHLDLKLRSTDPSESSYTMRYAVEIVDGDALLRANPDYPDYANLPWEPDHDPARPRFPINPESGAPDEVEYLRYLAYTQRYARAAASMYGTRDARRDNLSPYIHGTDGFDLERTDLLSDGSLATNVGRYGEQGHRGVFGYLMRGERYRWNHWGGSFTGTPGQYIGSGRVADYGTVLSLFSYHDNGTQPIGYTDRLHAAVLSPYGHGLRDRDWEPADPASPLNGARADHPNVPWRVNLLTASEMVRERLLLGLSSHLRFEERKNGGRSSTTNLLGTGYPEHAPLSLDDGRYVELIGNTGQGGAARIDRGFRLGDTNGTDGQIFAASRGSYWWDAVAALAHTIELADRTWNRGWDATDPTVPDGLHDSRCLLDPTEADPAAVLDAIENEWLRLIGEDPSDPQRGLLSTRRSGFQVDVGYGENLWTPARVEPEADTRAMEYLLNDLRMSLLGRDARNFNADDANRDGIVDAADAESTCAGWWYRGERTWSFWYPGLDAVADPANTWLTRRTWYRMWYGASRLDSADPDHVPGTHNFLARWNGERWVEYVEGDPRFDRFLAINQPFLRHPGGVAWSATNRPIKPWSATGRFVVDRSRQWRIAVRGQVLDAVTRISVGQLELETTYMIVPDGGGDVGRSRIAHQRVHLHVDTE